MMGILTTLILLIESHRQQYQGKAIDLYCVVMVYCISPHIGQKFQPVQ